MISGASLLAHVMGTLLLLGAGFCPPAAAASQPGDSGAWDVRRLMQDLRQIKTDKTRFVERRQIAILNEPLESSGTLIYVAPARLEKHTLLPRQESLVLERDRLTLENKARSQRRTFALQDYPVMWALVESIRSTLAGDLATLNRFYQVSLDGGERQWRLTLKPADPRMQDAVSEIRIGGSHSRIGTVEIIESNGDRALMTIVRDAP
jgi:hypothetical protein